MKRRITKILDKILNTKQDVLDLELAEETLDMFISMLKEDKANGHPCPDYVLKNSLKVMAVDHAKHLLSHSDSKLPEQVISALNFIIDYARLEAEGKPIPTKFLKDKIQEALDLVVEIRYGKD